MLAFDVINLEYCRALQQHAAKPTLPKLFPLIEVPSECKLVGPNRQISDPWSDRNFANPTSRKAPPPTLKSVPFSQVGCTTSNRFWPKNRSYRKQTIKPCLTGARMHFTETAFSSNFPMSGAALSGELRPYREGEAPCTPYQSSNRPRTYGRS
jgi:hypothetical protein